jgi:hypothetical protein
MSWALWGLDTVEFGTFSAVSVANEYNFCIDSICELFPFTPVTRRSIILGEEMDEKQGSRISQQILEYDQEDPRDTIG